MKSKNMKLGMFSHIRINYSTAFFVNNPLIYLNILHKLLFLISLQFGCFSFSSDCYSFVRMPIVQSVQEAEKKEKNDESMVILGMMRTPRKTTNRQRNSNFNENTCYMHMSKVLFMASWNFWTWNSTGIELHTA